MEQGGTRKFHEWVMSQPTSGSEELPTIPKFGGKSAPPTLRTYLIEKTRMKYERQAEENMRAQIARAPNLVPIAPREGPTFVPLNRGWPREAEKGKGKGGNFGKMGCQVPITSPHYPPPWNCGPSPTYRQEHGGEWFPPVPPPQIPLGRPRPAAPRIFTTTIQEATAACR